MKKVFRWILKEVIDTAIFCIYGLPFIGMMLLALSYALFDYNILWYVGILLTIFTLSKPWLNWCDKKFKKYENK